LEGGVKQDCVHVPCHRTVRAEVAWVGRTARRDALIIRRLSPSLGPIAVHVREDGVSCGGRRITGSVLGFEQENHDLGAGDGIGWAEVADGRGGTARGDSVTVGLISPRFERMSCNFFCPIQETDSAF